MIVGDRGVLIFDTGFRFEKSEDALVALQTKSDKPILGVVYSRLGAEGVA
jgi:alkyl sulfatase BDS1-like metallo-beta-lactamase superfamily hydrolase